MGLLFFHENKYEYFLQKAFRGIKFERSCFRL